MCNLLMKKTYLNYKIFVVVPAFFIAFLAQGPHVVFVARHLSTIGHKQQTAQSVEEIVP